MLALVLALVFLLNLVCCELRRFTRRASRKGPHGNTTVKTLSFNIKYLHASA
jgi:hypothetical protein